MFENFEIQSFSVTLWFRVNVATKEEIIDWIQMLPAPAVFHHNRNIVNLIITRVNHTLCFPLFKYLQNLLGSSAACLPKGSYVHWAAFFLLQLWKRSPGAAVKLLPCDHEVMGSSPVNSLYVNAGKDCVHKIQSGRTLPQTLRKPGATLILVM
jgi:hypothetical protein